MQGGGEVGEGDGGAASAGVLAQLGLPEFEYLLVKRVVVAGTVVDAIGVFQVFG